MIERPGRARPQARHRALVAGHLRQIGLVEASGDAARNARYLKYRVTPKVGVEAMNGRKARELRRQAISKNHHRRLKREAHADQGQHLKFGLPSAGASLPPAADPPGRARKTSGQAVAPADRGPPDPADVRGPDRTTTPSAGCAASAGRPSIGSTLGRWPSTTSWAVPHHEHQDPEGRTIAEDTFALMVTSGRLEDRRGARGFPAGQGLESPVGLQQGLQGELVAARAQAHRRPDRRGLAARGRPGRGQDRPGARRHR